MTSFSSDGEACSPETGPGLNLSPAQAAALFPFHILFERSMQILQVGVSLAKISADFRPGADLRELFELERPERPLDFASAQANCGAIHLLKARHNALRLRGQMISLDGDRIAYLGSPWAPEPGALRGLGLLLSDFALHDAMPELVNLVQSQRLAMQDLKELTRRLHRQRESLREANERLHQSEAEARRLALVAARTENGVVVTDALGRVEWVNEGFRKLTGYSLEEIRGRTPGSLLQGPGTDPATVRYIGERLRAGEGFQCEVVNYGKSGRRYWVSIEVQPIRDERGAIANFMAIESDITARKDYELNRRLAYAVTRILAEATDAAAALRQVLETIGEALPCRFGALWRVEESGNEIYCQDHWAHAQLRGSEFEAATRGRRFGKGAGLPGTVWQENAPVWLSDLAAATNFPRSADAVRSGLRSGFGLPIRLGGQIRGVMEFFSDTAERPSAAMLETLVGLGGQLEQFFERHDAERQRGEVLSLLDSTLESSAEGILVTDLEERPVRVNRSWLHLWRIYSPLAETLARDAVLEWIDSQLEDPAGRIALWEQLRLHPESARNDVLTCKDGRVIEILATPHYLAAAIVGRVWTFRDVTARWQADRALRESEERFRSVMESASDIILTVGEDGRIVMASTSVRILGYTPSQLMGRSIWRLVPPELRSAEAIRQAVKDRLRKRWRAVEVAALRRDGTRLPVEMSLYRARVGGRKLLTGVLRNISERKAAEEKIQFAMQAAEAANRAKTDFLAHVSHEIRTPLNAVIGMTELLQDTPLEPEQREMLETAWASAESLLYLINDILDISKIEAGEIDLGAVEFDALETCGRILEMLKSRANRKNLPLYLLLDSDAPARVLGDENRIRQILVNLAGNAVKFTERGAVVLRLRAHPQPADLVELEFRVEDTGIGIPSEVQARIFERYFRVDSATGRRAGGTGLGLSISRVLATAMGGTLDFTSAAGGGSCFRFTVTLPKSGEAAAEQRISPPRPAILLTSIERAERMREAWRGVGADAIIMDDLAGACRYLEQGQPCAYLLADDAFPGDRSGVAILARRLEERSDIRAVRIRAPREAGFAPWSFPALRETIDFPLTPQKMLRALTGAAGGVGALRPSAVAETPARVLLVEDNPDSQAYVQRLLTKSGHQVTVASTGQAAIEAARAASFDVILMDVTLADRNGFEVTQCIREREGAAGAKRTPIIALTAHALQEYRAQALAAGMDDFLSKPARAEALLSTVRKWARTQSTVLLVDDTGVLGELVRSYLETTDGFRAITAAGAPRALPALESADAVLLLSDRSAAELAEEARCIRAAGYTNPLLTAGAEWDPQAIGQWRESGGTGLLDLPLRPDTLRATLEKEMAGGRPRPAGEPGCTTILVEESIADLVPGYLAGVAETCAEIETYVQESRADDVRRLGHDLKGSGGAYGFEEVSRLGAVIERAGETGDLQRALVAVGELRLYLQSIRWEPQPPPE